MNKRPLLSIAIPTYNRAQMLEHALLNLINYCQNQDIEILVSNNASTDNTEEVVNSIRINYPDIRYYCNEKNLGFDGNFLNCMEKANGQYVWLLSDDDELLPGAIESVIDVLKLNPVCVHLNSSQKSNNKIGKPRFEEKGFITFEDKNAFIEKIGIYCTFVSSLIFNVDLVKSIENKEQYFKTNILQSHILLNTMKNGGKFVVNTYNCLAAGVNTSVSYDVYNTWVKNYGDLMLTTAPRCGFDLERMKNVLSKDYRITVFNFIVLFRFTCKNEKEWNKKCVDEYIELFPKVKNKIKIAINSPRFLLPILLYVNKLLLVLERKK